MVLLCECVDWEMVVYNVEIKDVKCIFEYDWKFWKFMIIKVEDCVFILEDELMVCVIKKYEV